MWCIAIRYPYSTHNDDTTRNTFPNIGLQGNSAANRKDLSRNRKTSSVNQKDSFNLRLNLPKIASFLQSFVCVRDVAEEWT